jgi:thioredoxin reductase
MEGVHPAKFSEAARSSLAPYREIEVLDRCRVRSAATEPDGTFRLLLDDDHPLRACCVVLATGVRDVFPAVAGFESFFGRSIFTCPSCDGYEAQGKTVAVVGDGQAMIEFAEGLLDWATSVTAIAQDRPARPLTTHAASRSRIDQVTGRVTGIVGEDGQVRSLQIGRDRVVHCDVVFWLMRHEQQSDLPRQLGCTITSEGCVVVDDDGATTVPRVFAAGDMTPGPHLIQLAAAEGTRAGIAAAVALRGHEGSPLSPRPAP